MRVKVTKAFRTYHNHQTINLSEGQVVKGSLAQALLAGRAPVEVVAEHAAAAAEPAASDDDPEPAPVPAADDSADAADASPAPAAAEPEPAPRRRRRAARPAGDG